MVRKMRRKDRQISLEEAEKILTDGEYGVLSTIGDGNEPYGVPLSYVYKDKRVWFHCATEGRKLDNIAFNNKASFCVVGRAEALPQKFTTLYESVIAEGVLYEAFGKEKTDALSYLVDKYSPDFKNEGARYIEAAADKTKIFYIEIENIGAKASR